MSATFNPYRDWLGIPDDGQPMNYYRLLGLPMFEPDPATIERAARRQYSRLQSVAGGEHAPAAQAIAGEIIMARNFLLSVAAKERYDRMLGAGVAAPIAAPIARPAGPAVVGGPAAPRPAAAPVVTVQNRTRSSGAPPWQQPLVVLSFSAALAIVVGVAFMLQTAEETGDEPDSVALQTDRTAGHASAAKRSEIEHDAGAQRHQGREHASKAVAGNAADRVRSDTSRAKGTTVDRIVGESHFSADKRSRGVLAAPDGLVEMSGAGKEHAAVQDRAVDAAIAEATHGNGTMTGAPNAATADESRVTATLATAVAKGTVNGWLKLDDNGEPCEATLADGTVLQVDTYTDSYHGFHALKPVDGTKAEVVVDYQTAGLGGGCSATDLRLDVAGDMMYWIESGPSSNWKIRTASMRGTAPRTLLNLRFQNPRALAIDHNRGKIYWGNHAAKTAAFGAPADARRAVWRAELDGSDPTPLFGGLRMLGGIAVEPKSGRVFYFDGLRLVRGDADGTGETVVIDEIGDPEHPMLGYKSVTSAIDPNGGKIYWCSTATFYARANLDGTHFEVPFNCAQLGGHLKGLALDVKNGRVYWAEGARAEVWRTGLDGTQAETIAVGMERASSVAVDSDHGYVFWTDAKIRQEELYPLIRKLRLPPMPAAEIMAAPPLIVSIAPCEQLALAKVLLRGRHFSGITSVRLIGDDGQQTATTFHIESDAELEITLPPPRAGVKAVAVVVAGPGGLTVTLPRDVRALKDAHGASAVYDRLRDGKFFCFHVAPEAQFQRVEHSVVYASGNAVAYAGGRGRAILFLKNGSSTVVNAAPGVVIYHEPFARIFGRAKGARDCEFVPVSAIRPSFVDTLLHYKE